MPEKIWRALGEAYNATDQAPKPVVDFFVEPSNTITVEQLRAKLSGYEKGLKIIPFWEGVYTSFNMFERETHHGEEYLVVDVDQL